VYETARSNRSRRAGPTVGPVRKPSGYEVIPEEPRETQSRRSSSRGYEVAQPLAPEDRAVYGTAEYHSHSEVDAEAQILYDTRHQVSGLPTEWCQLTHTHTHTHIYIYIYINTHSKLREPV
jgi:hypothetical protein